MWMGIVYDKVRHADPMGMSRSVGCFLERGKDTPCTSVRRPAYPPTICKPYSIEMLPSGAPAWLARVTRRHGGAAYFECIISRRKSPEAKVLLIDCRNSFSSLEVLLFCWFRDLKALLLSLALLRSTVDTIYFATERRKSWLQVMMARHDKISSWVYRLL